MTYSGVTEEDVNNLHVVLAEKHVNDDRHSGDDRGSCKYYTVGVKEEHVNDRHTE